MTDEHWDNSPEVEQVYGEEADLNTFVRVNGGNIAINPGANFIETVKATARDAGLGKFRVFLNGEEVKPSEAPESIAEGTRIELRPYDVAG